MPLFSLHTITCFSTLCVYAYSTIILQYFIAIIHYFTFL